MRRRENEREWKEGKERRRKVVRKKERRERGRSASVSHRHGKGIFLSTLPLKSRGHLWDPGDGVGPWSWGQTDLELKIQQSWGQTVGGTPAIGLEEVKPFVGAACSPFGPFPHSRLPDFS